MGDEKGSGLEDAERLENYEGAEAAAVAAGKASMSREFSSRAVGRSGLFAELRENDNVYPEHYMVLTNDGGGTKLTLCPWLDNFRTVGQDIVAMNANDMATLGRAMVDAVNLYFAVQNQVEEEKMGDIMAGIDNAIDLCLAPDMPFGPNYGKLETATLTEMLSSTHEGYGFDVGCSFTGFIKKEGLPDFDPKPGWIIIGLGASGAHSNGYTGLRHLFFKPDIEPRERYKSQYRGKHDIDDPLPGTNMSIGEAMLTPTEIYFRTMWRIAQKVPEAFGVNITGYGLKNFNRFGEEVVYNIRNPMEPHPLLELAVKEGGYSEEVAYEKFNMGLGFAVMVPDQMSSLKALRIANEEGHRASVIGSVDESIEVEPMVQLYLPGRSDDPIQFRGYN